MLGTHSAKWRGKNCVWPFRFDLGFLTQFSIELTFIYTIKTKTQYAITDNARTT